MASTAGLVVQALAELVRYDILNRCGGMRTTMRREALNAAATPPETTLADRIGQAMETAIAFYPRTVPCLHSSVAAARLYRRHGFHAEVAVGYLCRPLRCHAWVELDGQPVNRLEAYRDMMAVLYRA